MKKLVVILGFIAIFAACKKENPSPKPSVNHFTPLTLANFTVNIQYVKDCSMRPVAVGTEISTDILLKTDSVGNCVRQYQTTTDGSLNFKSMSFTIEGMRRGFGVGDWTKNETILFIQNDTLSVNVQFIYNTKTATLLKDSVALGYDKDKTLFYLPNFKRDTSFNALIVARNRLYRKNSDGRFLPFQGLRLWVGYNSYEATLTKASTGPCGDDSIIIQ
jgi:hypothetical protein